MTHKLSIRGSLAVLGLIWIGLGELERVVGWVSGATAEDAGAALNNTLDFLPLLGDQVSQSMLTTGGLMLLSLVAVLWYVKPEAAIEHAFQPRSQVSKELLACTRDIPQVGTEAWQKWVESTGAAIRGAIDGNARRKFVEAIAAIDNKFARDVADKYLRGLAASLDSHEPIDSGISAQVDKLRLVRKSLRDHLLLGAPLVKRDHEDGVYVEWIEAAEAMVARFTGEFTTLRLHDIKESRFGEQRHRIAQLRSIVEDYMKYLQDLANRVDITDLTTEFLSSHETSSE